MRTNKLNIKYFKTFINLFGKLLEQNLKKEKIVKIKDMGKNWTSYNRGYKTNDPLSLHSDGGKISALYCIRNSYKGGDSVYVDSRKIFKQVKNDKLKKKLFEGFNYHTRKESKDGSIITKNKFPIYYYKSKIIHCMYNRKPIEEALKFQERKSEIKYLNQFDSLIEKSKKNIKKFRLEPGNIWIVNNYTILHGRSKFKDSKNNRRLLLRAWLDPIKFKYKGKTLLDAYNNN